MEYDFYVYMCALGKIFSSKCCAGRQLLEMFPDPSSVFSMGEPALRNLFGGNKDVIDQILDSRTLKVACREVEWALSNGIRILPVTSSDYPRRLAECPDAPLVLYCRGEAEMNPVRALAVVGTRRATFYGKESCRNVLARVADNAVKATVISGLALGIDGVAHHTALELGLPTVAVIPTGLDEIYPSAHRNLAEMIVKNGGALVTDFMRHTTPARYTFVKRNRIIAGMADAVVLAESFVPGGGLITASLAVSYNREVFAVPGRMGDKSFEGCNKLIEENVASILCSPVFLEKAMGWENIPACRKEPTLFNQTDSECSKAILDLLRERSPQTIEEIVSGTGKIISDISSDLITLEVEGRIRKERQFYYICNRYGRID